MSGGDAARGSGIFRIGKPQEWTRDALCAQIGGDKWFPEKGESTHEARAVCRSCPVIAECLKYALDNDERAGVWGGMSERNRRKLRGNLPVEPEPAIRPLDPVMCGTAAQAKAHYRRGELPCEPCRLAANRDKLERSHKRRAA